MQDEMVSDLASGVDGKKSNHFDGRMRKVVLAGYYGFGNAGDELILSGILSDLRERVQEIEFTVLSGNPIHTSQLHDVHSVLFTDLENIRKAIAGSDLVLIGGGGILFDAYNNSFIPERILGKDYFGLSYYATVLLLSYLNHVPCMFYAVGIGPLISADARNLLISMLDLCSGASVRDKRSRDAVAALLQNNKEMEKKIFLASDPAFSIDFETDDSHHLIRVESPRADIKKLAVSLRFWDFGQSQLDWEKEIAAALDELVAEDGFDIVFIPFQVNRDNIIEDDYGVCERVQSYMVNKSATYLHKDKLSFRQCISILKSCDAVLGMRYHSVLLALKEGIPVIGLEYDPKVRSILEEYDQLDHSLVEPWKRETIINSVRGSSESVDAINWGQRTAKMKNRAQLSADLAVRYMRTADSEIRPGKNLINGILIRKQMAIQTLQKQLQRMPLLEKQAAELKENLSRNHADLQSLQVKLEQKKEEKEYLIAALEQKSSENRRIASDLEHCRHEQSNLLHTAGEQKAALEAAANEKKELRQEIEIHKERITGIDAELSIANIELYEIHHSRYWKILGLYWRVVEIIRRLFHLRRE